MHSTWTHYLKSPTQEHWMLKKLVVQQRTFWKSETTHLQNHTCKQVINSNFPLHFLQLEHILQSLIPLEGFISSVKSTLLTLQQDSVNFRVEMKGTIWAKWTNPDTLDFHRVLPKQHPCLPETIHTSTEGYMLGQWEMTIHTARVHHAGSMDILGSLITSKVLTPSNGHPFVEEHICLVMQHPIQTH